MSFPELPNPNLPPEHPGDYPRAPQQEGSLGDHSVKKIHKKSSLAQIARAVEIVAKVVFTVAFALPIGVSLLAAKKNYSHGALGGKADRMATKVRKFFGEFFGAKLSNKLFGNANKAALEHLLKSKYHAFFQNHPSLEFSLYREKISNVLDAVLTLSGAEEDTLDKAKQTLIERLFDLPPNIRKELLQQYKLFTSLTNQQFTAKEFRNLQTSNQLTQQTIPPQIISGEGISLEMMVDLPKNRALANYYKEDTPSGNEYKQKICDIIRKIDPDSKILKFLFDPNPSSLFTGEDLKKLVGPTFSDDEIEELKQSLKEKYDIYQELSDSCDRNDKIGQEIIKAFAIFSANIESIEDKLSTEVATLKQAFLDQLHALTKSKKPSTQVAELVSKKLESYVSKGELRPFRDVLGLSKPPSTPKAKKVHFIAPKPGYESRFNADLSMIKESLAKVGTPEITSENLIADLKVYILRLQGCCQFKFNEEEIKELLKPPEGVPSLNKDQIDEIVRFVMLPSKKSRS